MTKPDIIDTIDNILGAEEMAEDPVTYIHAGNGDDIVLTDVLLTAAGEITFLRDLISDGIEAFSETSSISQHDWIQRAQRASLTTYISTLSECQDAVRYVIDALAPDSPVTRDTDGKIENPRLTLFERIDDDLDITAEQRASIRSVIISSILAGE